MTAGLAVAASTIALAVAVPAAAGLASAAPARHARAAQDPPITIVTSGDRTSSTNGNSTGANATYNPTGGAVTGTNGVTYRVFSGSTATGTPVGSCTTGNGFPDGQCTVNVPSIGTYTIEQYSAPTGSSTPQNNYFINPALGVGTVTPPVITATRYSTLTVSVTSTAGLTVPMGSTATNSTTVRSGRWAVSRYNAAPPATCTRSVALLFDLSASITNQYLADYKAAATAYVQSLAGSSTNVTMYTFGTTAPVTGTNSPVNPYGPRNTNNPADVQALLNWIRDLTRPSGQYTNWDRGMWQMTTTFRVAASQHYNEAIVLTDGDPTAMSANGTPDNTGGGVTRFRAVEAGIFSANALKRDGTRVVAVGLEAHPTSGSIDNLKAISGPTAGSLATPDLPADYFVVPFDELKTLLAEKALADCARLTIHKEANPGPGTFDHVGQVIHYTYTVRNDSPADGFRLHNITVHDDTLGTITDCTPTTLEVGEEATCRATYTIRQADLDRGEVLNAATATGRTPNEHEVESPPDEEDITGLQHPDIHVTKIADPTVYTEGTPITYRYTVKNTGDVTLHNVTVTDDRFGTIHCTPTTLIPGQSGTCTDVRHTATAGNVEDASIENTVEAAGTTETGRRVTYKANEVVTARITPAIRVTKTASPATYTLGTEITYGYTVTNIGDVTLRNVHVIDSRLGVIACTPTILAPTASATCPAGHHTATQADVDAGSVHNTVTATGTGPGGATPKDEAEQTVYATHAPAIRVTKSVTPNTYTEGTDLAYHYTVTNTGNVTLTNLTVIDSRFGPIHCAPTTLAPGAAATCTDVSHTATTADVAAGGIHNNVSATGTAPDGEKVTDEAEQTVFPTIAPAIEVTKTASPREFTRPGEVITYTYVVTNAGDVTLHDVNLADSTFGAITCPLTVLAPGESMHCVHTHTTTQADVDAGTIDNAATAFGTTPDGQIVRDDAPETIHAGNGQAIEITKSARPTVYSRHGELITYTYTVTNTGNVTLRNVTLHDTRFGAITCPRTVLAPGETMACTHTHAISAVDLDSGSIFNSAAAAAHPPTGNPVDSEPENATVRGVVAPAPPVVPVTG